MLIGPHVLTVHIPGPVVGKGRPRFVRATGGAYTPGATLSAENRIAWELKQAWSHPPLDEALVVTISVGVPIPASKSKKFKSAALDGTERPVTKPDLDNILKLVGDAGNKVVWKDDARIVEARIRRDFCEVPGLTIEVARA